MAKRGEESNGTGLQGLVVRNTGNAYLVRDDHGNDIIGIAKGNLRLKGIRSTSPIVVGDRVFMTLNPDGTAFITDIAERRNYIVRKASNLSKHAHILAANIDLAFLCITVSYPETTTVFIDRFLTTAEAYSVPVCLIFNKIDLYDDQENEYLDALIHLYSSIGYRCLKISTVTGEGKERLEALAEGKIVLLAGHSGVGKSSIVNLLVGDQAQQVREISLYHHKGTHTTTFSEMIEWKHGGFLIDTPGIKGFGTIDMIRAEVSHYFPEIFKISKNCKYNNCLHLNEPGCAVLEAVENHHISESRYNSYLNILEDIEEGKYRL
ncbi:ribosome small subunit-dependent GTPase A [Proteiniphilum sp. X52]|uniref:ribosome small subunit-dependent GTPase A n=1 Tax=Proteiniphilum sp. X52 TaxID=2382159 RepID=UPI000F09F819|nr:ribosome small subunit-dependent GTPase A [Proteiniphilum sp. X52]RNC66955.1 ribosome small subunit-dependent GTPase A [Proteiniphilum sp. X52]